MAVDVGQGITDQSGGGFCAVLVSFQGKKGEELTDVLGKQCGRPLFLMNRAYLRLAHGKRHGGVYPPHRMDRKPGFLLCAHLRQ